MNYSSGFEHTSCVLANYSLRATGNFTSRLVRTEMSEKRRIGKISNPIVPDSNQSAACCTRIPLLRNPEGRLDILIARLANDDGHNVPRPLRTTVPVGCTRRQVPTNILSGHNRYLRMRCEPRSCAQSMHDRARLIGARGPKLCPFLIFSYFIFPLAFEAGLCLITACAAASLAMGTRKGEQLT